MIRVRAAGRTLWGDDHYVDHSLPFIVRTFRKKIGQGFIPGDLVALGFTVDPIGKLLRRLVEHIFLPELAISSL